MDNMNAYAVGITGTTLLFHEGSNSCICLRTNVDRDQTRNPYELKIVDVDHIENIEIHAKDKETIFKSLGFANLSSSTKETLDQFMDQSFFTGVSTTGSTGDGNNWDAKISSKPGLVSQYAKTYKKDEE
jgi:hypothetical protein